MSERTEVSFDAALMMALRADAQKELDELPTPAQLKERYPDTSRWDARLQAALHKRRPMLKRVLAAALTLVILTLGALAVSADFRKTVYTMIQKFLPIEMPVQFCPLCRGVTVFVLHGDAFNRNGRAISEPGFHPVGVHIVAAGKQFVHAKTSCMYSLFESSWSCPCSCEFRATEFITSNYGTS